MSYWCPHCNSFLMEDNVWWISAGIQHTSWWCAICGEIFVWRAPNRLLLVQTGESVNQGEVCRAHAVPRGLCDDLINALKLLANQQEDGDGTFQSMGRNLCEGSSKGLTEGLRNFVKVNNHCALERRQKCEDACPECLSGKALKK